MSKLARMTNVTGLTSVSAILAKSGTDWRTHAEPVMVGSRPAEDYRAIVRNDTGDVLGITGTSYRPNNHADQLAQLQPLLDSGFLAPAHVAEWDNGSRLAFQFRCPELDATVGPGDTVSPLLTLAFGHDGTFSDRTFLAKFRWFCKNQMGAVRAASAGAMVRHVGSNVERYEDLVRAKVQAMAGNARADAEVMRRMRDVTVKGLDLLGFFATAIGAEPSAVEEVWTLGKTPEKLRGHAKVIRAIVEDYRADATDAPGSLWQAYNGITRWTTHTAGRSEARRSEAILGSKVIETAWDSAVRLTAA